MSFFDRLGNGWSLGMTSLRIIRDNANLLIFPVMSTLALIFVALTFFGGFYAVFGLEFEAALDQLAGGREWLIYVFLFVYYLVNFFVIVFFNVGLVHCARLIFEGRTPTVSDGLNFAASRLGAIISWAVLAATVGVVLQALEDRLGWLGKIIINIVGVIWSIATFFVVPVIAYENVGPFEAVKRSGAIMKEKWGESIGANFSFGLFFILGYLAIAVGGFLLINLNPIFGIVVAILSALLLHTIVAAAKTVFIAATYNHISGEPAGAFDEDDTLDSLFIYKAK
jgi:hypothetical protein